MNPVQTILSKVSDEDLKTMVRELMMQEESGILPDGLVRRLAKEIREKIGIPAHDAAQIAQRHVYILAARRWAKQ